MAFLKGNLYPVRNTPTHHHILDPTKMKSKCISLMGTDQKMILLTVYGLPITSNTLPLLAPLLLYVVLEEF